MDPICTRIALGAAGVAGVTDYWINQFQYNSTSTEVNSIYLDGVDDIFVATESDINFLRFNYYGQLQASRKFPDSTNLGYIAPASSGNSWIISGGTSGTSKKYLALVSDAGVLQTAQEQTTNEPRFWFKHVTDSSGDVYVAGAYFVSGTGYAGSIAKYSGTTGAYITHKSFVDGTFQAAYGLSIDSSNNIYIGLDGGDWIKLDTSLNILTAKTDPTYTDPIYIDIDSNDNKYFAMRSSSNVSSVTKLDSSDTVVWRTDISDPGGLRVALRMSAIDSSGNVYVVGSSTALTDAWLVKLNSSGVLQWSKKFSASSACRLNSIMINSLGDIVLGGFVGTGVAATNSALLMQIPSDGSTTPGTYGGLTIANASLTGTSSSVTYTNYGYTVNTSATATGSYSPTLTEEAYSEVFKQYL